MATPVESFTAVLLQLNMHYKARVAVKLTGILTAPWSPAPRPPPAPRRGQAGAQQVHKPAPVEPDCA